MLEAKVDLDPPQIGGLELDPQLLVLAGSGHDQPRGDRPALVIGQEQGRAARRLDHGLAGPAMRPALGSPALARRQSSQTGTHPIRQSRSRPVPRQLWLDGVIRPRIDRELGGRIVGVAAGPACGPRRRSPTAPQAVCSTLRARRELKRDEFRSSLSLASARLSAGASGSGRGPVAGGAKPAPARHPDRPGQHGWRGGVGRRRPRRTDLCSSVGRHGRPAALSNRRPLRLVATGRAGCVPRLRRPASCNRGRDGSIPANMARNGSSAGRVPLGLRCRAHRGRRGRRRWLGWMSMGRR